MSGRATLYGLLLVVAGAAAMLSFAALRDLAELCGFAPVLAWLLPVVVDAGAAAGSLVWLGERTGEPARRFARRLALGLLGLSVAANALGHGLAAFVLRPPWWVVVLLSGIAPAVLGAMVHLAVLVGRPAEPAQLDVDETDCIGQAEAAEDEAAEPEQDPAPGVPAVEPVSDQDPALTLIAAGAGRRRLSRELGVTEYEARRLLERARSESDAVGAAEPVGSGVRS